MTTIISTSSSTSSKKSSKKAPAAPPSAPASAPVVAAPESTPAAAPKERKAKLAKHLRFANVMQRAAKNLTAMDRRTKGWSDEVATHLLTAIEACEAVSFALRALPATFVAPRKDGKAVVTVGRRSMTAGNLVCLTDKGKTRYTDLLEQEEIDGVFAVVRMVGAKAICTTAQGSKVIIPRGHLYIAAPESAPAVE